MISNGGDRSFWPLSNFRKVLFGIFVASSFARSPWDAYIGNINYCERRLANDLCMPLS
jgi:hypothetical protein